MYLFLKKRLFLENNKNKQFNATQSITLHKSLSALKPQQLNFSLSFVVWADIYLETSTTSPFSFQREEAFSYKPHKRYLNHPSSLFCTFWISMTGLQSQQFQEWSPNIPALWKLCFPPQGVLKILYIICPACFGSDSKVSSKLDVVGKPLKGCFQENYSQMPKPPQLTHFDMKEQ